MTAAPRENGWFNRAGVRCCARRSTAPSKGNHRRVRPSVLAGIFPHKSVVDQFGRTHDIANLFICDGSIMPTQGSANPGLMIMALAARIGDYLITEGTEVFASQKRNMRTSSIRRTLSAPDTWGHGMPRM
ncbi:MAG: hypothetical protein GIW99_06475 [Candidatus Eremiobacteraeota bacterium]|nr:hypothetical protein [Candidatus Eremiobacteraeota bacterium]MBC5827312.1 hypothetical protein [Candidatus Eremiobacteraeota bacterium]